MPEENCTFAFYLCNKCAEKWAPLAGTMAMPDEVFWQKVKEEQLARYGRVLTPYELAAAAAVKGSTLATLAKEAPK